MSESSPANVSTSTDVRLGSGRMFDSIAHRYDLLNRILSLGIDQGWRRRTVRALALGANARVLDLATGTADLAMLIARTHPDATVVGVDPSTNMLDVGRTKIRDTGLAARIALEEGDAQSLRFADDSFDGATIAFGIRNVPDRVKGLSEMARVTKPGARVVILELSEPRKGILGPFARFHVHHVVPFLGALISGSREYRYLQQSIEKFPPPEEFAALMREAGLEVLEVNPLTFGVACLYVGTKRAAG